VPCGIMLVHGCVIMREELHILFKEMECFGSNVDPALYQREPYSQGCYNKGWLNYFLQIKHVLLFSFYIKLLLCTDISFR